MVQAVFITKVYSYSYHPTEPIGPFDARVAAIIDGLHPGVNDTIITSPNMDIIYKPPLGRRLVHLRNDCRYADDDYTLWPQPFMEEYCWLPVIPRCPEDPADPLSIMWWNPTAADFVPTGRQFVEGLGKLEISKAVKLRVVCEDLFARITDYQKSGGNNPVVLNLRVALRHSMCRLESLTTFYKEMVFGVTETQRWYLELVAVLDYITIFKPRMEGSLPKAKHVAFVVGAFTENPQYVQAAFDAGIPVWFMRPLQTLSFGVNIMSVTTLRSPEDFLTMTNWTESPSFPVIHNGSNNVEKVRQIHNYARTCFQYPDPFAVIDDPFLVGGSVPTVTATVPMAELERPRTVNGESVLTATERVPVAELEHPRTVKVTKKARKQCSAISSGTLSKFLHVSMLITSCSGDQEI
jgi:hypothetical protein